MEMADLAQRTGIVGHIVGKDVYRQLGRKIDGLQMRAPWNEALYATMELFCSSSCFCVDYCSLIVSRRDTVYAVIQRIGGTIFPDGSLSVLAAYERNQTPAETRTRSSAIASAPS
jgi:hypothetical protein